MPRPTNQLTTMQPLRWSQKAVVSACFAALIGVQVFLVTRNWPFVGHDYAYFQPRLLDVQLHYASNGPSIQW